MPTPLEYQNPLRVEKPRRGGLAIGALCGVACTVPAFLFGLTSAMGDVHGDGVLPLFFPLLIVLDRVPGEPGGLGTLIAFTILFGQYPFEGALMGWTLQRKRWLQAALVPAIHVALAILASIVH